MKVCLKWTYLLWCLYWSGIALCKKRNSYPPGCNEKVRTESFLWTLQRDPPVHFFGTIHVPYTRVWDYIPKTSKRAFRKSENVFFELDLTNGNTLSALSRCQMLPTGQELKKVLPSDLYERLQHHFDYVRRSMPNWLSPEQKSLNADYLFEAIVGNWKRKKPVWVMLMINSLTEADVRSRNIPVLDLYLARQAERMGKKIGAVEKVDEQCQPLNGLNMSQVFFALNHTLAMQEKVRYGTLKIPYTTDDLIDQYNCGELNSATFDKETAQMPQLVNQSDSEPKKDGSEHQDTSESTMATAIDLYFKQELIYRRNHRMAERVKNLLEAFPDQSFFFAFGAGHFLGNGSVIDFLRKEGLKIKNSSPKIIRSSEEKKDFPAATDLDERKRSSPSQRRKSRRKKKNKRKRTHSVRGGHRNQSFHGKKRDKLANEKQRTKFRDLWVRIEDSEIYPKRPSSAYQDDAGGENVRVINRYPTVFPQLFDNDVDKSFNQNKQPQREQISSAKKLVNEDQARYYQYHYPNNPRLPVFTQDWDGNGPKFWREELADYEDRDNGVTTSFSPRTVLCIVPIILAIFFVALFDIAFEGS
ncbi:metalloprotease TIKI1-like isoform X2 [Clavelina lepadiformis]|uniref:metalloprotease TIKI1-like isoform X2 n=1 Tax=Clavelina lepadiformis TaxID=159417 RepID=UPI004042A10D